MDVINGREVVVYERTDVNNDGVVNSADVTAVVDYIIGRGTLVNEAAAYVNGDNRIDIADVAALISLIGNSSPRKNFQKQPTYLHFYS